MFLLLLLGCLAGLNWQARAAGSSLLLLAGSIEWQIDKMDMIKIMSCWCIYYEHTPCSCHSMLALGPWTFILPRVLIVAGQDSVLLAMLGKQRLFFCVGQAVRRPLMFVCTQRADLGIRIGGIYELFIVGLLVVLLHKFSLVRFVADTG
jgi:hypothetical protein